jgi:hypothetical protein
MLAHSFFHVSESENEVELFGRIQLQLIDRYGVDPRLASEMAWDFIEVLSAVDGNMETFEKYFLH